MIYYFEDEKQMVVELAEINAKEGDYGLIRTEDDDGVKLLGTIFTSAIPNESKKEGYEIPEDKNELIVGFSSSESVAHYLQPLAGLMKVLSSDMEGQQKEKFVELSKRLVTINQEMEEAEVEFPVSKKREEKE